MYEMDTSNLIQLKNVNFYAKQQIHVDSLSLTWFRKCVGWNDRMKEEQQTTISYQARNTVNKMVSEYRFIFTTIRNSHAWAFVSVTDFCYIWQTSALRSPMGCHLFGWPGINPSASITFHRTLTKFPITPFAINLESNSQKDAIKPNSWNNKF